MKIKSKICIYQIVITGVFLLLSISCNNTGAKTQVTGTFTDSRDGKIYKTVKIGTQTWMAENLAFKSGSGCWAYDNNESNVTIYGYLYNWETAKNVCPSGWHLPADAEWSTLIDYVGGDSVAGDKLKEAGTTHWESHENIIATNEKGFTALPAGFRQEDHGVFLGVREGGRWWSSTEFNTNDAWFRTMLHIFSNVDRSSNTKTYGFSVRCVKD